MAILRHGQEHMAAFTMLVYIHIRQDNANALSYIQVAASGSWAVADYLSNMVALHLHSHTSMEGERGIGHSKVGFAELPRRMNLCV